METPTKIDVMANQGRSPYHFIRFFCQTSHYGKRALILKIALKLKAWFAVFFKVTLSRKCLARFY